VKVVVAVVHRLTLMKSRDEINTATRGAENATQMMIPQVHLTLIYHQWIQGLQMQLLSCTIDEH